MNADTTYHDLLDQEPCLPSLVLPCVLPMSRGVGARCRLGTARNVEEDRPAAVAPPAGGSVMPTLPVALQEGFVQDDIVVRVNGSEIPPDTVGSPRSETIVTPKRLVEDIPEVRVGRAIVGWVKSQPPVDPASRPAKPESPQARWVTSGPDWD
jgi:hypothetical protein